MHKAARESPLRRIFTHRLRLEDLPKRSLLLLYLDHHHMVEHMLLSAGLVHDHLIVNFKPCSGTNPQDRKLPARKLLPFPVLHAKPLPASLAHAVAWQGSRFLIGCGLGVHGLVPLPSADGSSWPPESLRSPSTPRPCLLKSSTPLGALLL